MNGLIYATRGGSKQPVTIGLAVHDDLVVQGPPYAGRLNLVDRKTGAGIGKSGQSAWKFLTFMGWRCEWVPTYGPCAGCGATTTPQRDPAANQCAQCARGEQF